MDYNGAAMTRSDAYTRLMAIALAGLAGLVDGIGFTLSQGFFVSFMSGNSTRLGVGVVHDGGFALTALLIIAAFVAGVAAGTCLNQLCVRHRRAAVMALVAAMLSLTAAALPILPLRLALCLLAAAMGASNVVLEAGGEVRIGVTYMTGALVRIGQSLGQAIGGRDDGAWLRWLPLWLALVTGAFAGAGALTLWGPPALWLAAAMAALLACILRVRPIG